MAIPIASPAWFFGVDLAIDAFSLLVCLLIAPLAYRIYRFTGEDRYRSLALGFTSVGLAYVVQLFVYGLLYYAFSAGLPGRAELLLDMLFVTSRTLILFGWTGLLVIVMDIRSRPVVGLVLSLLALLAIFSRLQYVVFHITSLVLLSYVVGYFVTHSWSKRKLAPRLVTVAFLLIFASQILFLFLFRDVRWYVAGKLVQALGFLILLASLAVVSRAWKVVRLP